MSMTFGELVYSQMDKAELRRALDSTEVKELDINDLTYRELMVYTKWCDLLYHKEFYPEGARSMRLTTKECGL